MARPRRKRLALSKRSKLTSNSRSLPHHDSEEDSELSSTDSSSVHGGTEITGLSETDPDSGNDSGENDNEEDEGDGADITDGLNGSRTMASANNDEDYDQDEEAEVRPPASTAIMVPDEEWYKNNPKRTPGNYHYPKEMILHGLQITEQQLHKFHIKAASILKEDPNAQANYVTAEETIMRRLPRSFRKVAYQNQWAHSAIQKWLRHTVKRILNPRFFRPMGSKTKNGSGTKAVANSRKRRRTQSPALSEQIPGTRRSRGARPQTSPGNHQTRNRERHSRAHTEQPQVAPPVNSSRVARQNS
ncbi:hypothetical protein EJ05DRAFT_232124 [Pseudovirgaria hyperparasitica]|uniref:Uncharacterized protein n=1 Tax=Pseudovirgaria hyperparasitica TaxID=470096 RepID=A0A6A6VT56_9PEZI|nr:uncharacterized protein EJ05DRAFT_232124 [Pseudovirgaria hyperparasitica]KAF2752966.1 hypothetical protein EJ05DRAFT_232124 [Pseudovirgaria hyperparasitica]